MKIGLVFSQMLMTRKFLFISVILTIIVKVIPDNNILVGPVLSSYFFRKMVLRMFQFYFFIYVSLFIFICPLVWLSGPRFLKDSSYEEICLYLLCVA